MTWWQFVAPVMLTASLVRIEALFVGPYWAWLELVRIDGMEDESQRRPRRMALIRRVAIPGVVGLVLSGVWNDIYSPIDAMIVAAFSALVLLLPVLLGDLPYGVRKTRLAQFYALLISAFVGSSLFGSYVAGVANAKDGFWAFVQDSFIGLVVGAIVTAFAVGGGQRVSTRASEDFGR